MFDSTKVFLFLTAAVLLAIAPGPGMLYVLARSLAGGKREGVLSAFGTFLGGMVHVIAAALGISIVLAKSALAFAAVKYLGTAYLCFLGIRMIVPALFLAGVDDHPDAQKAQVGRSQIFHGRKGQRRLGQHNGNPQSRRDHVDHPSKKCPERREHTFTLPTRQASRKYVEHPGSGGDGEQNRRCEEEKHLSGIKHLEILFQRVG